MSDERAFKILSGPNKGGVMRIRPDEFDLIFNSVHPSVAMKALAWCEFTLHSDKMVQVSPGMGPY